MLVQRVPVSTALPFDLASIKVHSRVDFNDADDDLTNKAWTAAAEVEQFAQIALLTQTILVNVFDPNCERDMLLPIGPVADDAEIAVTIDGTAFTAFDVIGGIRPMIRWRDTYLALTPSRIIIEYTAGFGDEADDIPRDLAEAIRDQAALHYDGRSPMDAKSLTTSPHMARVGARYRGVQV
ncbi:MAG: head-tail connector protein [Rhodobacterales bacterium]|uniref:head-tail connector protein n=1 Tax=Puniceibacterium antarcticum TaxID=1206336 RepID=UPI002481CACE|nr:hypothetical protein [Puniceibacterium antarcticum]